VTDRKTRAFVLGGVLLLAAAIAGFAYLGSKAEVEDEDRPPIIVKNGSLDVISGDKSNRKPEYKKGKPWITVDTKWQPDHPKGKPSSEYTVLITASDFAACPASGTGTEVLITYVDSGGENP